ncbi:MAG: hypothetical protein C0483_01030 [Pirellula sp.]|nr:hypothetical protein [Pirellula sp.]
MDDSLRSRVLSDFVRPGDHFLPLGVLSLSVDSLSQMTIDDLRRLPGVGLVKIRNLLGLSRRVIESKAKCEFARPSTHETGTETLASSLSAAHEISELEWSQWREELRELPTVREPIGRYVSRLDELPSGSWFMPLAEFCKLSLRELRELPGYGPRRVGAIIVTIRTLLDLRSAVAHLPAVVATWESREIARADAWFVAALNAPSQATYGDLQSEVLEPLTRQIRHDLGAAHVDLALIGKLSPSRVRQIRHDLAKAILVRWPRGEQLAQAFLGGVNSTWTNDDMEAAAQELGRFFMNLRRAPRFVDIASHPARFQPARPYWGTGTADSYDSMI